MFSNKDLAIMADLAFAIDYQHENQEVITRDILCSNLPSNPAVLLENCQKPSVSTLGGLIYTEKDKQEFLLKMFTYALNELADRKKQNPFIFDFLAQNSTQ